MHNDGDWFFVACGIILFIAIGFLIGGAIRQPEIDKQKEKVVWYEQHYGEIQKDFVPVNSK